MKTTKILSFAVIALPALCYAGPVGIEAVNPQQSSRHRETLELSASDLATLGAKNLNTVHIKDSAGKEVLCQAIDLDGDPMHTFDAVIFQTDFAPGETKTFTASVGEKQVFKKEQFRAFGRFVRERYDDFAWENDIIAHRTYGKALESWKAEPLTSSTIDVWSKRSPRMVINDWYLADDYHADHGEGADFYSAGLSRGCGGNGLWSDGKLAVSGNFTQSRVLANGPIRVLFELEYEPFNVGDVKVSETKRISLDAGSHFDHFRSTYKAAASSRLEDLKSGIGLKKVPGEIVESDPKKGWLVKWEKMEKGAGNQGLAVITSPGAFDSKAEDSLNQLLIAKIGSGGVVDYHAGFCWDKAGPITNLEAWKAHVGQFVDRLAAPIKLTVTTKP
jgi:hypothetical protein